ncbi:IS66 family transposase [Verrucomicrobium sp. BvORR034]|uniref:IS66 family transposase n=1 Tax=Verrucomicrobium sp. BvORR034 TaxID=1396418 RepID=UPI0009DEAE4B|nr:IS66 family transposase [Verrucomicrobium sp. BvORR034]
MMEELRRKGEELAAVRLENKLLRLKLDALSRRMFGKSSEKLDAEQMQLLLDGIEELTLAEESAQQARPGKEPATAEAARERKPRIPEHLPVKEVFIDPEEVKACPEEWVHIGQEVTEQLEYTPASFERLRIIRRKYVRKDQRHLPPVVAPLQPCLQERCLAAPSLLAHSMVSRYRDHLPWHRLEGIYAGLGVEISRQTLANWSAMTAEACGLLMREIHQSVFASGYVQLDETPIEYLSPGHGQTKTGYLWVAHSPLTQETYFQWHTGRAALCLESLVPARFEGIIQCDGYAAYGSFAQSRGRAGTIRLAGCWAHARRKFFETATYCQDAAWVLLQIQEIYAVEEELRQARAGPEQRQAARAARSRPVVGHIYAKLEQWQQQRKHLPKSPTGVALRYAFNQRAGLEVFLEDGRVEIDSNLVENTIRPSAVGKKNWLFVGDAQAGDRAAAHYTLLDNARRAGADAYEYLKDLFMRLPSMTNQQMKEITPRAWMALRADQ